MTRHYKMTVLIPADSSQAEGERIETTLNNLKKMKTIAQRVDELIKEGNKVHCLIIGCMGPILEVFHGSFIVSFPHRRGIHKKGCLRLNDKLNSPKFHLYHNKAKNRYEVVHRKKHIEKMTRGKTNVGAGLVKALTSAMRAT